MDSPAISAVTGKVLSAHTLAGYAADWALFTDWCTATYRIALPADWATITAFIAGCPGAPAGGSPPSSTTTAPPTTQYRPIRHERPAHRRGS